LPYFRSKRTVRSAKSESSPREAEIEIHLEKHSRWFLP
jgi:hypothetical protein